MTDQIAPEPVAGTPPAGEGTTVEPVAQEGSLLGTGTTQPEVKPAGATEEKPVVPEKYDLKLPKDSLLTTEALERKAADAKARGLTNEQAQKELENENATIATYVDTQKQQQEAEWKKQNEAWVNEIKSDKEIGGEAFPKNVELAKRVVQRFGDDSFVKELDGTGFGNHPGLVRMLVKLGKAMSEDQLVLPGSQPAGAVKSSAEIFYSKSKE